MLKFLQNFSFLQRLTAPLFKRRVFVLDEVNVFTHDLAHHRYPEDAA